MPPLGMGLSPPQTPPWPKGADLPYLVLSNKVLSRKIAKTLIFRCLWWAHKELNLGPAD